MLGGILKKILGDKSATDQKKYQPVIQQVNDIFNTLQNESDDALRGKTDKFRKQVQDAIAGLESDIAELTAKANTPNMPLHQKEAIYEIIDTKEKEVNVIIEKVLEDILPEAFAVVKETARRWAVNGQLTVTATELDKKLAAKKDGIAITGDQAVWSNKWTAAGAPVEWVMIHYDVQLMGGAVLHRGNIAEMQTGEGKTLVATLPVYLNALSGKGVHVVTVNDYLAKRDSEWMGPLYQFHGLTVDCIDKHQPNSEARRAAYMADITFGTNNEFGFDYLRDNMASATEDLVQRKHHFAIVDEVDSVLIDDARTPLIISGPTPKGDQHEFYELKPRVELIVEAQRKYVNQALADAKKLLTVINGGTVEGMEQKAALEQGGIALLRAHRGLPKNKALHKFLSEPGIKSHLQKVENQYMAEQGKQMKKIDVELFFVIDEKQNTVELTEKGIDLISGNEDRNFFVMPDISSEIAQLQKQSLPKEEFNDKKEILIRDYTVKSERIHSVSQLLKAYTLFEKEVEYVIMDGKIKIVDEQTGRIMEGRRYSDGLHQAIEAKENVTVEAATQTYATITLQNYFRMYHKLAGMTGTAETEAKEFWDIYKLDVVVIPTNRSITRIDHNDLVFKTAREKYAAVIEEVNKLVEAGRPVLVGTTTVEISELLSRMLKMRNIPHQVLNAKYHQKEAEIVALAGKAGAVTIATNMAGRGTDIKLGEGVKEAGGLAIIGTERHDSRRVDRQLRGRSGRQGDPGSSTFFVSLEDDLMRKFGSERIARIMDRLGLKEGEVIQHSMVSKSIERAQKKVEENNFGIRKRLLEYDDVMNAQRKAIYKKRRNALFGDRLGVDVSNMFYDVIEGLVNKYQGGSFEEFNVEMIRIIGIDSPVSEEQFKTAKYDDLVNDLYDGIMEYYNAKNQRLAEIAMPQIKHVYENLSHQYQNIQFLITDGVKTMPLVVSLKEAYESNGASVPNALERNIVLGMIDNEWKEHLREMDDLRSSVQQAVYEQKDPLLVYKLESFELFKAMNARLSNETVEFLVKADVPRDQLDDIKTTNRDTAQNHYEKAQIESASKNTETPRFSGSEGYEEAMRNSMPQQQKQQPIVSTEPKIGRNDPCPCGSGKKYKQCHGK
ncbi:preprotein translocase subunit SecA [Fluviicola sp.]|jgi:preprotein translocase subunit SecA|uniref:preprotein translocase subunit SecA n=1 Tax=Fluviicola sp. TaxID=1917219 RepID=UPI0028262584|nr:preprotein translocase subunit SecA [Fluviicola sp.]MDR0802467.1 preprotein translocase subunit SecA [Fluviicola sp.]